MDWPVLTNEEDRMKFKYSTYSCNQNIQEINRSVNKEAGLKKSTHTHTTAIGNFKAE